MIKSIKVTNYLNESITMVLTSPELSGLAVTHIDGLGPVKANINTSDLASDDGAIYNSARLEPRYITLELMPIVNLSDVEINTVEKIRHKIYKYFPIKKGIKLQVETDERVAYVTGYVEEDDLKIFESKETATVRIKCPDPWFYSEFPETTSFASTTKQFSFPFHISKENKVALSSILSNTINNVYYSGDSETGIVITVHASGPAKKLRIYNLGTHESMSFDDEKILKSTGSYIKAGDEIVISTIRGAKSVFLNRDAIAYNILNSLGKNADWFQISKGDNQFAFTADDDGYSNPMNLNFEIDSTVIYEGV